MAQIIIKYKKDTAFLRTEAVSKAIEYEENGNLLNRSPFEIKYVVKDGNYGFFIHHTKDLTIIVEIVKRNF